MPPVSAQKLQDWKDQGFEPGNCPVRQVLDHVSAKWPVLILLELGRKPMRFNELLRALPDISKRMLTQSLRNLERDGILRREVFDTKPPSVTYSLSELGEGFLPHLLALVDWAENGMPNIVAARQRFDAV
ncbi:helix-turn-helix transcriptional regulator [Mameliella sp. CS4]|uniref:winged helix-turn-helix transcriptional regulator n=1 Tax=Mameliella sp. CS4 TaxID=2862329 RepID=UPI001C606F92|nr:helix-turn-helix domain-containing protein [Mameliella sp. CS4]MBW4982304.1 helix-turn-helix transcriptional regulator [Mameliella sp. CS4]